MHKLKDTEPVNKELVLSVRKVFSKRKEGSVMVESACSFGRNPGSRPVFIKLGSSSNRPCVFERAKDFSTMGLSVTSDRSKMKRQVRETPSMGNDGYRLLS